MSHSTPVVAKAPLEALERLERTAVSWLSPELVASGPDEQSRALILSATASMCLFVGVSISLARGFSSPQLLGTLTTATTGGLGIIVLGALRSAKKVAPIARAFLLAGIVLLTINAWLTGGLDATCLTWLGAVPMIGYVIVGRRFAHVAAGLALVPVLAFFWLDRSGLVPRHGESALITLTSAALLITFLTGYTLVAGGARERAIRRSVAITKVLRIREKELSSALLQAKEEHRVRAELETRLRLAQKLESIGRLAAGVAHEINTPVQFVGDSLRFAHEGMRELIDLLQIYRTTLREVEISKRRHSELVAFADNADEEADLDYLLERLPMAVNRATEGLERITEIVQSMKELVHHTTTEMQANDLTKGIRSTLVVASAEYESVADLETELADLPLIVCHLGEINQVVLNLVVNAAHAIREVTKVDGSRGLIKVTTRRDGEHAVITVSDTGGGIATAIRAQVFDPFFTTKEVGAGSGQGLAVVHGVVERHGGSVSFESEEGRGTTFTVRLPVEGPSTIGRAAA